MFVKEALITFYELNKLYEKNTNLKMVYATDTPEDIILNDLINTGDIDNTIITHDKIIMTTYLRVKNRIINLLLNNILNNYKHDVSNIILTFKNIKTQLYAYQINNVNWMIHIENKCYMDEYKNISKTIKFKGGGLFDDFGLGKTLQSIALILSNPSTKKNIMYKHKLYSKATLIILPPTLCGQWEREINKHLDVNNLKILKLITKVQFKKFLLFDYLNADIVIVSGNYILNCNITNYNNGNENIMMYKLFDAQASFFNIYWHRIVIDEYHTFENSDILNNIYDLKASYKWIVSSTPFNIIDSFKYRIEELSITKILKYLTNDVLIHDKIDFNDKAICNFIIYHFSKNQRKNNVDLLKLPKRKENVIKLDMNENERMMYNAHLTNDNNTLNDITLRQLCCHPALVSLNSNTTIVETSLEDIQNEIKEMYLQKWTNHKKDTDEQILKIQNFNDELVLLKRINNVEDINKKILQIKNAENTLIKYKSLEENALKPVLYYKNFLEIIKNNDSIVEQECPICLGNIEEDNVGITTCCHLYCYTCISMVIEMSRKNGTASKCTGCMKHISKSDIYLINKITKKKTKYGTKLDFLIEYIQSNPNKYRIIFSQWNHLLESIGKILTDSGIKILFCKGSAYSRDIIIRTFQFNEDANSPKILMMSSDSSVSGSDLSRAEEVIFTDPIYSDGNVNVRINMENQAIGRMDRLGSKNEEITITRLIMKNTVEEDIYNINKNFVS